MSNTSANARLLDVAIEHFGRRGLNGASTRSISRDAGVPMSSITYHFGGKEGLYVAAAGRIATQMAERLAPAVAEANKVNSAPCSPREARAAIHLIYAHMVSVLTDPATESFAGFIVREQADPTEAFTLIYDGMMSPLLERVAKLLRIVAGGRLADSEGRLRAIALMGQVLIFRVARQTALRGIGWSDIGVQEVDSIRHVVADHLDAAFDRIERHSRP